MLVILTGNKKLKFGVASNGIMSIPNYIKIHLVSLMLKHGQTDVTSPICVHFIHTVWRMHNNRGPRFIVDTCTCAETLSVCNIGIQTIRAHSHFPYVGASTCCHNSLVHMRSKNTQLTAWMRDLLEKPIVIQLVKKFTTFHETKRFIIMLTRVLLLDSLLRQMKPVHTLTPYFFKSHLNITLPSIPNLQTCLFPSNFPTKNLHALHV
jgi:hypothetical protein